MPNLMWRRPIHQHEPEREAFPRGKGPGPNNGHLQIVLCYSKTCRRANYSLARVLVTGNKSWSSLGTMAHCISVSFISLTTKKLHTFPMTHTLSPLGVLGGTRKETRRTNPKEPITSGGHEKFKVGSHAPLQLGKKVREGQRDAWRPCVAGVWNTVEQVDSTYDNAEKLLLGQREKLLLSPFFSLRIPSSISQLSTETKKSNHQFRKSTIHLFQDKHGSPTTASQRRCIRRR